MNTITIKRALYGSYISKLQPYQERLISRISYYSGIPYQNIIDLINEYPEYEYIFEYKNEYK